MKDIKESFKEFCRYKCPFAGEIEFKTEFVELDCNEIGCDGYCEGEFDYEIDPCKYCSAKHFMQFLIDENNK